MRQLLADIFIRVDTFPIAGGPDASLRRSGVFKILLMPVPALSFFQVVWPDDRGLHSQGPLWLNLGSVMSVFTTTPAGLFTLRSTSFVHFFHPKLGKGTRATSGSAPGVGQIPLWQYAFCGSSLQRQTLTPWYMYNGKAFCGNRDPHQNCGRYSVPH